VHFLAITDDLLESIFLYTTSTFCEPHFGHAQTDIEASVIAIKEEIGFENINK
jgi:hypothetical protein